MDGIRGEGSPLAIARQLAALQDVRARAGNLNGRTDVVCLYHHPILSGLAAYIEVNES